MTRKGIPWNVLARHDMECHGRSWKGKEIQGMTWKYKAWHGNTRKGKAWHGKA